LIYIEKVKKRLILKYSSDFQPTIWLDKLLKTDKEFTLAGVFHLDKSKFYKKIDDEFEEPEFLFVIGNLVGEYYKIDNSVFGLKNDFYFYKNLNLNETTFVAKSKISLLYKIDSLLKKDLYIGGAVDKNLPYVDFINLIKIFPTTHEIKLYRQAKVTSILKNYFKNVDDKELAYNDYMNKKVPLIESKIRKTFKESEIIKYQTLVERLESMLNNEINYNENQWQSEIIQIILLLFPKYIAVFKEVHFLDIYSNKNRRLDYGLIDFMGNLDIVEIKIPFEKNIVSDITYRDNHIPNRDLSGTIMQIEKYIFYLNKSGKEIENKLTKKYKDELPDNLEIRITNPSAIIIMGRDNKMDKNQLHDFEIIKRKYRNVIDIFTYDDLIRRLKMIITQLKKI
jgi:hypothetical protein